MSVGRIFLLVLLFTGLVDAAHSATDQWLVVVKAMQMPSGTEQGEKLFFFPGQVVRVVEKQGALVLVESKYAESPRCKDDVPFAGGKGRAWVAAKNLVGASAFKPLLQWNGEKEFEVFTDSSDSGQTMQLHRDATFSAYFSDGGYTEDRRWSGRLYRYGPIIWARSSKKSTLNSWSVFWLRGGSLCYFM